MKSQHNTLKVSTKYGKLEAEIEGTFDEVWKFTNSFFKQIKVSLVSNAKSVIIVTKGEGIPEILIELNNGFFDEPRDSMQCLKKLKKLGKTEIKRSAVQMALKRLVELGKLKRVTQGRSFAYSAILC